MTPTPLYEDPLRSLRVLVVEDQSATLGWLCDMLRSMQVRDIKTASDGVQALQLMRELGDLIDIILCDWLMPRMTGIELLRAVRQERGDVPFVMITGNGTLDAVLKAKSQGVSAFVVKPFSRAQLEVKLRIACRGLAERPRRG